MSDTLTMRASDQDRQQTVDLLRGAVEDGRLTLEEYLDRMELAYRAVTYSDLAPLVADLPGRAAESTAAVLAAPAPGAPVPSRVKAGLAGLPVLLRILWGLWLTAVLVNVVVWTLVTITSGHLPYPWPLWVAGPYGSVLLGLSATVTVSRRHRTGSVPPDCP